MRKTVLAWAILALCLGFSTPTHAQNLVLNPSFEELDSCPTNSGQLPKAIGWTIPGDPAMSPDLCDSCGYGIHYCGVAKYILPRTGSAIVGSFLYFNDNYLIPNYVENIQGTLFTPLVAGQKYKVSMYISLADSAKYAISKIGVYFYNPPIQFWNTFSFDFLVPQVSISIPYSHIYNRSGWTYIDSEYIASGGEQYFIIGSFEDFHRSDTINTGIVSVNSAELRLSGYYLIDDVSVEPISSNFIQTFFNQKKVHVYPNPSHNGVFAIENIEKINHITIYDIQGKTVKQLTPSQQNRCDIDVSELPAGLYSAVLSFAHHTPQCVLLHYTP
jgi:hypothetical protein